MTPLDSSATLPKAASSKVPLHDSLENVNYKCLSHSLSFSLSLSLPLSLSLSVSLRTLFINEHYTFRGRHIRHNDKFEAYAAVIAVIKKEFIH